ncbi:MAG: methyltransferase domain-containing protein [Saprospiraceae bacterium]|nr:methyltransferase domain-containing protein [Saprospiraceae bacterium]
MKQPTRPDIGQVFDEIADGYTSLMEDMVPHYRQLITAMLSFLPKGFRPQRIMDLGCGNGNVTAMCKHVYPTAQYHLVDASSEMIERCKQRFGTTGMTYHRAFFQDLTPESSAYDLMIAGFSFHHVPAEEKRTLFKTLYPAISANGVLTSADLFVNKDDEPFHSQVIEHWKRFSFSNGRTQEDWDWVMDHYDAYDRPSAFADQKTWLLEAGFARVELSWHDGPWGCLHAYKETAHQG